MTETEFTAYFQAIAQSLIAISDNPAEKHRRFARFEQVWDGLKTGIDAEKTMLMVVKNVQGNIEGLGSGNLVETQNCSFMLVRHCKAGNFQAQKVAFDDTLMAARKVVGKMVKDKKEGHSLMQALRLENVQFHKVEVIFDLCFGYEVKFIMSAKNSHEYTYQPADWQ